MKQKLADAAKADIIAGKQKVFTGPLYDQSGAEKVPAGTTLTDKELLSMDWFVKGVDGKSRTDSLECFSKEGIKE